MVEQLFHTPDIYRIYVPLPDNPLKYLNCYVLMSKGETLIIDTGFNRPECREALFDGLDELHVDFTHTRLFLTHLHGDHSGLTEALIEKGVPVFMGAIDYNYLCSQITSNGWQTMEQIFLSEGFPMEEIEKQKKGNQARLYSPQHPFPAATVQDNDVLTVGNVSLRCIHTPGHTPGHICLYIEEKEILFSGDHILFDITPNISVWRNVPYSLANYLESLQKIQQLKVSHTFPGHREFHGDIRERIDALTHHHHERLREIQSAIDAHPDCTAYETAGRISWSARGRAWEDFSPNQKWFAMGETLAHIKWLADNGAVSSTRPLSLDAADLSLDTVDDYTEKMTENRYRALCHSSDLCFYSGRFSDDFFCDGYHSFNPDDAL